MYYFRAEKPLVCLKKVLKVKLYFPFLIIFYWLCITVVPIFPHFPTSSHLTPTPSGDPHTIIQVHGHVNKFFGYSIFYTVLYIPMAIL